MTDRIDLDDLETADESTDEDQPNRGDWLWRDDADPEPETEPDPPEYDPADVASGLPDEPDGSEEPAGSEDAARSEEPEAVTEDAAGSADPESDAAPATPRVPRTDDDSPVGIPKAGGGSGGSPAHQQQTDTKEYADTDADAGGPHGGGADDRTQVFTYEAIQRLENLHATLADVEQWADWVGVVGEVDAHVINKFQRENQVDLDFFNGTGTGPAERLAEIDEHSMFYAERMVVVGCEDEAWFADAEEWEFVPLETAAEKAGWKLSE